MRKANRYEAEELIAKQVRYYESLPEKQRRHFLALEYERLGVGSQRYVARVFGCARQTIRKGMREWSENNYEADYSQQRVAGGGRKKKK